MLHLRTFGGTLVESDAGCLGPAAGQRRVLALLSIVACGGSKGVTRDYVLGLLWPDSDAEKARQALNQTLYHTKRALQVEELFQRGTDLRLDPNVITADVSEFERLLDEGDVQAAISLYRGPFLEGFFVNGAPEFERWCSLHRTRLAERYAQALERSASAAVTAGNTDAAIEARRKLAAMDPLNTRVAMELIATLASHGDRAGALKSARIHIELLRQELGIEPDPVLLALVSQIKAVPRPALQATTGRSTPPMPNSSGQNSASGRTRRETVGRMILIPEHRAESYTGTNGATANAAKSTAAPERSPSTRWTRRRVAVVCGAAAGVVILATTIAVRLRHHRSEPIAGSVVVAPFRVLSADRSLAYLREGMVELLSTKLAVGDASHAIDPSSVLGAWRRAGVMDTLESDRRLALSLARGLGGERLLTGSVMGGPSRIVLNATLIDVIGGQPRAQASVEGDSDSLLVLVDRLAARLLADESLAAERLSQQTTTSLAALRAYLDGHREFRSGRLQSAVRHFRFAVDRDSTFALAALGLAQAAERVSDEALRERAVALAWSSRHVLGERERLHLLALAGPRYPAASTDRERLLAWEQTVAALPERADVWQGLGQELYHAGRRLEVPDAIDRARAAFERAHELDPSFASPLPYLVMTAVQTGDLKRAQHYAQAYLRLGGELELGHFVRWYVARANGDSVALAAARAELPRATVPSLRAISIVSIEDPVSLSDALQAVSERLARTVGSQERGELLRARHALALNAGRPSEARAALEELAAMRDEHSATAEVQAIFDAIFGDGDKSFAARAVARFSSADNPSPVVQCAVALWHASHGAFARAREQVRGLTTDIGVDAVPVTGCRALVEAWIAIGERQPEAQRLLNPIDSLTVVGLPLGDVRPYGGIALARLYVQLGAPDLALAAVRRRPYYRAWPAYLASYLRMEATLAEQLGDRAAATRAWRHYLTLRERPESVLAADAARASEALARVSQSGP